MKKSAARIRPGLMDITVLVPVLLLVFIGIWLVYDSSFAKTVEANNDSWFYAKKQFAFAAMGIVAMLIASRISAGTLQKISTPLLMLSIASLILLYPFGTKVNGALRWYKISSVTLQPSEIAKLAIVIYLAGFLSQGKKILKKIDSQWTWPGIAVLLIIGLVFKQPDMGTALAMIATCMAMWIAAGGRKRHIIFVSLTLIMIVVVGIKAAPYRFDRVQVWLDPWQYRYDDGYQVVHSLIALGRGGVIGSGLCEGLEKLYLPATSTDFIFSTVGEETGLIGSLIVLALFMFFIYVGLRVAKRAKNTYSSLLAVGITSMIGIQACINVAVVSALIPATGVTLPFVSYGGSSLIITLAGVGVLLSVSRTASESRK
ncbi:MAG: putative lipid II flippase FtsW [Armatimonadota bacterium]|jgi:cell division protein FtsW